MKKKIVVPFLFSLQRFSPMKKISAILDNLYRHPIDNVPWPDFPYKPEVYVSMGYGLNCLFLKYYVSEAVVKASYFKHNDPVCRDSCVEFFIAFDDEPAYYNCEWNAVGTCLLTYGPTRNDRKVISEKLIAAIKYSTTLQNKQDADGKTQVYWDLTLMIPLETFSEHTINSLSGKKCRVNFHKCGDDLPEPHFLTWSIIKSEHPDFHLPEFFGECEFE